MGWLFILPMTNSRHEQAVQALKKAACPCLSLPASHSSKQTVREAGHRPQAVCLLATGHLWLLGTLDAMVPNEMLWEYVYKKY